MKSRLIPVLTVLSLTAGAALADGAKIFPLSATYKEECGSCHVAYPPELMSQASWRGVMRGLDKHFGSDASLDRAKAAEISAFLDANAAGRDKYATVDAEGRPLLRITDGAWFRREHRDGHDGITPAVWKSPAVKSAANCGACHRGAEQGDYSESKIRIPRS
jgi:hypothetical protein